mmetsp:Transcript_10511/g.12804  ORF Transcript_10511/g.12804 Transcript_10511/m.12804 type:complete len:225 (-) Transcript_10511:231-905(-)
MVNSSSTSCSTIINTASLALVASGSRKVLQKTVYTMNTSIYSCVCLKYGLYVLTNSVTVGTFFCSSCPTSTGSTTRHPSFRNICPKDTGSSPSSLVLSTPKYMSIRKGVRKTPIIFPAAALKTAAASSPPELLVSTNTILIVRGRQLQISIPSPNGCDTTFHEIINRENPYTIPLTAPKLKSSISALNLMFDNAFTNSAVLRDNPASRNMKMTAIQVAVIWGAR